MICSVKRLRGQPIVAADGPVGFIVDVYFDDRTWKVRYLVLDTGRPMPQRQVLVSPSHAVPSDASIRAMGDPHLRSAEVVSGFAVHGPRGRGGHLNDILVDTGDWTVRSLVVDSGLWLPGKRSLVSPSAVQGMDWIERSVEMAP